MPGNIIEYDKPFAVKNPQAVTYTVTAADGSARRAATATGYIAEHLQGRRHSANHNFQFVIPLGFRPGEHAVSLAPRGMELRGVPLFGFRRVGWSIVDYETAPEENGIRVTLTVWVNHRNAWSLGLFYSCTALAAGEEATPKDAAGPGS